jgi:glycosyltransferase involved in cell wall biosynthesis
MRILLVHNRLTSFVRHDLECLRQLHEVSELCLTSRRLNPVAIWRQVEAHDLVFGWFASWHTFLPVLFARLSKKPSVLVIGGYDLAKLPSIGYGHQRGGLKKWVSRATMRLASALITNSLYSVHEARSNAGLSDRRVRVIYHGIADLFGELPARPRERMAITIGNVDRANLHRKGLEPFVRAAQFLPSVKFVVIGDFKDGAIGELRKIAGANVEFTGWVDDGELLDYCRRASVYVQVSRHEGFGMAVAEAMAAGCIPVVTRQGALPEVVGDTGVYTGAEPHAIAKAILWAMNMPEASRARARQRVLAHFSLQKRRALLAEVIAEVAPETVQMADQRAG